jgi:hypothetical protein
MTEKTASMASECALHNEVCTRHGRMHGLSFKVPILGPGGGELPGIGAPASDNGTLAHGPVCGGGAVANGGTVE